MKHVAIHAGILSLIISSQLFSNPTGAVVTVGDVTIDHSDAHHLHVNSHSDRSIITWKDFSIDSNESAYFQLPDSASAILNRVDSHFPSTIAGLLESNGHVYLINPNGVLVTEQGVINTSSFLASTLDVHNEAFLKGADLLFAGLSEEGVINQGRINASNGDVILLGYVVRNDNVIDAKEGVAALGAASEILLTPLHEQRITIQVPVSNVPNAEVGVAQNGTITALQTELKASGNVYALAVHNSGFIQANAVDKSGGRVYLVAEEGLVSHTGKITAIGTDSVGGDVQILGKTVSLTERAVVDVSGDLGGGSALIGGDYQGKNPEIQNALHTFIEEGVTLSADALKSGNGGMLIVWGVESTGFFGYASAQGGTLAGNGGLVEVSSRNGLYYKGTSNTLAEHGSIGTLLLDPTDITIVTGVTTAGFGTINCCYSDTYCGNLLCATQDTANIDPADIITALKTSNVIIDASEGTGLGSNGGSITIKSGFDTTGTGNNLTLVALTDLAIYDDITHGGKGTLTFYGGSYDTGSSIVTGGNGTISLVSGKSIFVPAVGDVFFISSSGGDAIDISGTIDGSSSGNITLQSVGGSINLLSTGVIAASGSGTVKIDSAGFTNINGDIKMTDSSILDITGNGIFFNGTPTVALNSSAAASFTVNTNQNIFIGDGTNTATITKTAGTGDLTITSNSGQVVLQDMSAIVWNSPGALNISSQNFITGSASTITFNMGAGGFAITGGINFDGTLNYGTSSAFSVISSSNPLFVNNNALLTFNGGGTVTFSGMGVGIILNNTAMSSFAVSNGTTLQITETSGAISMGTNARLDDTSAQNLVISTTTGNINFDSTSLINFNPGGPNTFQITSTSGNVNVGNITSGPGTGTTTISSTNQKVQLDQGSLLDWSNGTAGTLQLSAGAGLSINGDITYGGGGVLNLTITNTGSVDTSNMSTITVSAGAMTITGTNSGNAVNLSGAIVYSAPGDLDFLIASGNLNSSNGSTIMVTATGGNLNMGTMGTPLADSIFLNGLITYGSTVSGKSLSMYAVNQVHPGSLTITGTSSNHIESTMQGVFFDGGQTFTSTTSDMTITAPSGQIDLNGTTTFTSALLTLTANNNLNINGSLSLLGSAYGLWTATNGNININAPLTVNSTNTAATQFIATTGDVSINNSVTYTGAINANPLTITANGSVGINNLSFLSSGDFTATATNGSVNFNTINFPVGSTATFTATSNSLALINGPVTFNSTGDFNLTSISSTIVQNGPVTLDTLGTANISAGQYFFCLNTFQNLDAGDMNFSGTEAIRLEPGLFAQGQIIGGGGNVTLGGTAGTTDMLLVLGSATPALIESGGGPLNITTSGDADLFNNVSVDSGAGLYTLSVGGSLSLLAAGNTIITGSSGVVTVTNNLFVVADEGGFSEITATGNVTISGGDGVYLIGYPSALNASSISSSGGGDVSITVPNAGGTIEVRDFANITTSGAGNIVLHGKGNVIIDNDSTVDNSAGTGSITIGTSIARILGSVTVNGGVVGPAVITAGSGGLSIFAAGPIIVGGISSINTGSVTAISGPFTLNSLQDVILNPFAAVNLVGGAGAFLVTATHDLMMSGSTSIANNGTGTSTFTIGNAVISSSSEGSTTITTGSGITNMTSANKILFSSSVNPTTWTAGGNTTVSSTLNGINFEGTTSSAASLAVTGTLTMNAMQSIRITDNGNVSSTGNMFLTTTLGDLMVMNGSNAGINAGGSFTATIPGDVILKASAASAATTSIIGATGIQFTSVKDFYMESGAGNALVTATTGDVVIIPRNFVITGSSTQLPTVQAASGNVTLTVTNEVVVTSGILSAGGMGNAVSVTSTSGSISLLNGSSFSSTAGSASCSATLGTIYLEGGPVLQTSIVSGSGGTILNAKSLLLNGLSSANALLQTNGSLTITASQLCEFSRNVAVNLLGPTVSTLSIVVTGGQFVASQNTLINFSGPGTTSISGTDVIFKGGTLEAALTTIGDISITASKFSLLSGTSSSARVVTTLGDITITASNEILLAGIVGGISAPAQLQTASGALTINGSKNLVLIDNANISITGMMNANTLQLNITGDLIVSNASSIVHSGTGLLQGSIGSNAHIFGGALGDAVVSSQGTLSVTTTGLLDIQAGGGFQGKMLSNGLTSYLVGSLNMLGQSPTVQALLQNANGDLNVTSGLTMLNAHATLSLTGGGGSLVVNTSDDLMISNDSIIQNSSTGTMNITSSGTITLLGGAGDASIQGYLNTTMVSADDNIYLLADTSGVAMIKSDSDLFVTSNNGYIYLIGSPAGSNQATISSSDGALIIKADSNITLLDNAAIEIAGGIANVNITAMNGSLIVFNASRIQNLGTGTITTTIGADVEIIGGIDGASSITANSGLTLLLTGDLDIEALSGSGASINAAGDTTISASRINMIGISAMNTASILNTTGFLSVTGTSVGLNDFAMINLTGGSSTLTVDSTGDMVIANGASIQHFGTGLTTSTVTGALFVQGGTAGPAGITGGIGGLTVNAGSMILDGFSAANNAVLVASQGDLNVTTGDEMSLNTSSTIALTSPMGSGAYLVTVGNGLSIGSGSSLQNAGTGTTTVNVTGTTLFSAGSSDATLTGNTGLLTLTSTDDIQLLSSLTGRSAITSVGQIVVNGMKDVNLIGSPTGPKQSLIQTSSPTSSLSVTAGQNIVLLNNARIAITAGIGTLTVNATSGNLILENLASIQQQGTGSLSLTIGNNATIHAGANGTSFLQANGNGVTLTATGALMIQSLSGNTARIQAAGSSSITAAKIDVIGVSSGVTASISNSTGNLTVSGGIITLSDAARITLSAGVGTLTVNTTSGDLSVANNSIIQNTGSGLTTSGVTGSLYIEGGSLGASSFLGGIGGLSASVGNQILLTGFTTAFNAVLSTTQGNLTLFSTNGTSLNAHATISISSPAAVGTLGMTVGNDLLVANDALIRNFGTGLTNINVTGVTNILSGAGTATIRGGSGAMTLTSTDNINIISDVANQASIQSTGNLSVSTMQNIYVIGSPSGIQSATIQTGAVANPTLSVTANILAIRDGGSVFVSSGSGAMTLTCIDLNIENSASLQHQGTGALNSTITGDCYLRAGTAGGVSLLTHSPLTLAVGGDLKIEADANSTATISSQGATSISAARIYQIGVSDTFSALITNSVGALTVTAGSINLIDFGKIQLSAGTGVCTVNATSGDLRMTNGSFIKNLGTGLLQSTIGNTLYIEAGIGGKASYTSLIGGVNITANAVIMNGFSSGNNALISAAGGAVSVTTNAGMTLSPFANISLTGPASSTALGINVGADLLIANGSSIQNAGTGTTTVAVTGVATLIGGTGDSSITGNAGAMSFTVGNNLHIISDISGRAFVFNKNNITVSAGADVHVIGAPEAALSSSISTTAGTLSVTAMNNVVVEDSSFLAITAGAGALSVTATTGDLFVENASFIQQQGTGSITVTVGGNGVIKSGSSGNAFISNSAPLNVAVSKDLLIEDVQGLQAYIASNGATTISSNRLFMLGYDAIHQAYIQNGLGNLMVSATSIRMMDFAKISIISGAGTLTVNATNGEFRLSNGSLIQNAGTGPTMSTVNKTLYIEGGANGASSLQGGSGGINVSAESILMSGYSSLNNAMISAANGTLNLTTTGMAPLGNLNMTPNSKIILNAGSGNVNVIVSNKLYKSGNPTITTSGSGTVNVVAPSTCSCP